MVLENRKTPISTQDQSPVIRPDRGLILLLTLICLTLFGLGAMLSGCGGSEEAAPAESDSAAHAEEAQPKEEEKPHHSDLAEDDSLMALLEGEDPAVIDQIMANLEILDYSPTEVDLGGEEGSKVSKEDSVNAAKWIASEEKRLSERESSLDKREKELNALDKKVSQKVLRLEQAESARVVQLARLYDGMDSRAVAQLMANLDDNTVVSILPRMKPKNASLVLQLMPATRAAKLSKQMITIAGN